MNRRIMPVVIALVTAFTVHHIGNAAHAAPMEVGAAIPDAPMKLKNVDGRELTLADLRGEKGTLVIFSCNHCPWAIKWEERIVALGNEYAKKGVGVAVVNSNDPAVNKGDSYEGMQTRAKERGMTFPYVCDETSGLARAFGAERTPEAFLFDSTGKLVYHGTIDDNANDATKVESPYLSNALAAMVAGKEIETKETKALGCGIKFRAAKNTDSQEKKG
jgi:peroxiredoxin